jgi:hypothetical protein
MNVADGCALEYRSSDGTPAILRWPKREDASTAIEPGLEEAGSQHTPPSICGWQQAGELHRIIWAAFFKRIWPRYFPLRLARKRVDRDCTVAGYVPATEFHHTTAVRSFESSMALPYFYRLAKPRSQWDYTVAAAFSTIQKG